ncbi:TetR/AcrR family transcriptional regulator [Mycobacterium colombiense]|uniref:TetR family transcriptional regulator n=1 Tax=Mycobacterium colombiense CECT 3035 TaxID=1041522 RepID=J5EI14_9MYCO|nr:TetR/AcrR family transcriptional regulator [Mycobacterium colombiense]EJO89254.1 TetR family transcriptional regulator [Mycobacterium colombiense CECT 3035]
MARRRLHALDDLLDAAERLVVSDNPAGFTLRGLATAAGVSNGTIYHAFHSRDELLARLWLRAAARLGAIMNDAVNAATNDSGPDGAHQAVVDTALAPAILTRRYPASAQLFFAQRRDQLFSTDLTAETVAELTQVQERFVALLVLLARGVWDRADRIAVDAITACIVDIPGGMLRRRLLEDRPIDAAIERRMEAAVRAVLAVPLDPPAPRID